MVEQDKRNRREICEVYKWVNKDNFWKTNVLSPSKLREKYDELKIKMGNPVTSGSLGKPDWQKIPFNDSEVQAWATRWKYPICPQHIQDFKTYKQQILTPAIEDRLKNGYTGDNAEN